MYIKNRKEVERLVSMATRTEASNSFLRLEEDLTQNIQSQP